MPGNNQATIEADVFKVRDLAPSAVGDVVRARYEAEFGQPPVEPGGWYRSDDWRRTSFVLEQLRPASRILDVGTGAGQFANMLAASSKFESVSALDHIRFGKYRQYYDSITRYDASIAELPFEDGEFDVVTCMEVLEHIPDDVFVPGLAELRRVCGGQLVMSVPFCEQEPLSKGHLRRFEAADVAEIFPDATLTLLDRPRMPWLIVEERLDGTSAERRRSADTLALDARRMTADERRIERLEGEIARLRARRSLRLADTVGAAARRLRSQLEALRPSR